MISRSKIILLVIILCDIAAIVGYYFIFQHIIGQTLTAASLTSTIDLSQQKNSRLSSLRTVVKDTESNRQKLSSFLLPNDSEISFVGQVEVMAQNDGLDIKTNSINSVAGSIDKTKTLQIQVTTTGTWTNILYFMNQIENLPYNIHINNFSFAKQSAVVKASGSSWTATFDISVTESI